jgi:hypothetical protein
VGWWLGIGSAMPFFDDIHEECLSLPLSGGVMPRSRALILVISVVAIAGGTVFWTSTKHPAAARPLTTWPAMPEAITTRPDQFIPEEQWPDAYRQRVREGKERLKGIEPQLAMKLYGLQRGVDRPDGWVKITSTGAGFSVAMPGSSADSRVLVSTADNVTMDIVECGALNAKWMAICTRGGEEAINKAYAAILKPFTDNPDKCDMHAITQFGYEGYDIFWTATKGEVRTRVFKAKGIIYSLGVDYPNASQKDLSPLIERFLNSLSIPT